MVYGRGRYRYRPRRTYYRRRGTVGRSSRLRRSSRAGVVRRFLSMRPSRGPELKGRQCVNLQKVVTTTPSEELLSYISTGTYPEGRVGNKILLKYLTYDIKFTPVALSLNETCRLVVWYCKYPHGENQYFQQFMSNSDPASPVALNRKSEVIILLDKRVDFFADSTGARTLDPLHYKGKIPLNLPMTFNGTGGDIGSHRDGAVYCTIMARRNSNPVPMSNYVLVDNTFVLRWTDA